MHYDAALKQIFLQALPALLRTLGCAPVEEILNVEFPSRHRVMADVVMRLADRKILHMECQSSNDPNMHWRCHFYFGAIASQWPEPEIVQVVVYFGQGPMSMQSSIDRPTLKFRYTILDLQTVDAAELLASPSPAERVLAVLGHSADLRATIREVLVSWRGLPEKELKDNVRRLHLLSHLRKVETIAVEEIAKMPFDIDITDSVLYQQGKAEGMVAGKAAGMAAGKAAGEMAGMRRVLVRMLERRFGKLPRKVTTQISNASEAQLDDWTIRAIDAKKLSDVL